MAQMTKDELIAKIKNGIIVSCQALPQFFETESHSVTQAGVQELLAFELIVFGILRKLKRLLRCQSSALSSEIIHLKSRLLPQRCEKLMN